MNLPPSTLALDTTDGGPSPGLNAVLPAVYDEMRLLAATYLRRERPNHTLQPTALVHEAYLRLTRQRTITWENRAQVLGVAAHMMRRILADYAIARGRDKRGGHAERLNLEIALATYVARGVDVIALDEALTALEALDPRQARIVELRFFAGLPVEEVAALLEISPATVKRQWAVARLFLRHRLREGDAL